LAFCIPRGECEIVSVDTYGVSTRTNSEFLIAVTLTSGILDGGAVTRLNPCAVHLDCAGGRNQIAVALEAQRIVDRLASLQSGTQHTGVGADRQRVTVLIKATGQGDKASRAVTIREGLCAPRR
jgi:hypothetical protein